MFFGTMKTHQLVTFLFAGVAGSAVEASCGLTSTSASLLPLVGSRPGAIGEHSRHTSVASPGRALAVPPTGHANLGRVTTRPKQPRTHVLAHSKTDGAFAPLEDDDGSSTDKEDEEQTNEVVFSADGLNAAGRPTPTSQPSNATAAAAAFHPAGFFQTTVTFLSSGTARWPHGVRFPSAMQIDPPITEQAMLRARSAGARLVDHTIDVAYVAPSLRARMTLASLIDGAKAVRESSSSPFTAPRALVEDPQLLESRSALTDYNQYKRRIAAADYVPSHLRKTDRLAGDDHKPSTEELRLGFFDRLDQLLARILGRETAEARLYQAIHESHGTRHGDSQGAHACTEGRSEEENDVIDNATASTAHCNPRPPSPPSHESNLLIVSDGRVLTPLLRRLLHASDWPLSLVDEHMPASGKPFQGLVRVRIESIDLLPLDGMLHLDWPAFRRARRHLHVTRVAAHSEY